MKLYFSLLLLAIAISFALGTASPSWAKKDNTDYPPPVVDEYRILTNDWFVIHFSEAATQNSAYALSVKHDGKSYLWPIRFDFMMQAIDTSDVANGDTNGAVVDYIRRTMKQQGKAIVVIKLASLKANDPLFVRFFDVFDPDSSYEKAVKRGSPMLNMDIAEVKELGLDGYKKKVVEITNKDWKALVKREKK